MSIDAITSMMNVPNLPIDSKKNSSVNFGDYLKNALNQVNDMQLNADQSAQNLMTGETSDIHQVMLASEEAKLSLSLAVQIRNKLVDSYQEIMRMQL